MQKFSAISSPGIRLREICGEDEQLITDTDTRQAVALLQALSQGTVSDDSAANDDSSAHSIGRLPAWDRDCLLASLYTNIYGPRVASSLHCEQCEALFDLDFSLLELMDDLAPDPQQAGAAVTYQGDGKWCWEDRVEFRLPTAEDECAVADYPAGEAEVKLLSRCVEEYDALNDESCQTIQQCMQVLSPVVNLDLDASCPECGTEQQIGFDLQRYLLTSLRQDRQQLNQEVHTLASAYGWSLTDILRLPRGQRRLLVARIEADDSLARMGV